MEECEEIEERGVQRDHPPAPEKTFRGRWMISDRKRTDLRRAAAVIHDNRMLAERAFYCCYKKEPEQKPKNGLFFTETSLLCGSVLFLVAMTKKLLFTRVAFQCF